MKVKFFIESLGAGGAERVLSVVTRNLVASGVECEIIVFGGQEKPFYKFNENIKINYLQFDYSKKNILMRLIEQFNRIKKVRNVLKDSSNYINISFMSHCNIRVALASIGLRVKLICCEHNNYYALKIKRKRIVKNIIYYFIPNYITVLTNRDTRNYPRFLIHKIKVLPNPLGIEISKMPTTNKFNNTILAIGRLTEQKGYERLLRIFSKIKSNKTFHEWKLQIAGDGHLKNDLIQLAEQLNITESIIWLGNIKAIENVYLNSDIYVMTSHWEGLPMVLGEALHFGLPVVAYDCPTGPREFIQNNKNGFLISDNNEEKFIEHLKILMLDAEVRRKMSKNARDSTYKYTSQYINEYWIELLNQLK